VLDRIVDDTIGRFIKSDPDLKQEGDLEEEANP